ncbi:uncharacterized protein [Montipora capricornis]|uniref:uncharacterized protein n=1 Tax=Montipora capricornis TaxID=246305 RepID=UPI0035F19B86
MPQSSKVFTAKNVKGARSDPRVQSNHRRTSEPRNYERGRYRGKQEDERVHYLSHHAVTRRDRETTLTKLRIVYDGSAKPTGRNHSLNYCLETRPNYKPQLFDKLVKFHWHKIGLIADLEKAFLMIGINETDRDMVRFLWFKDPSNPNSEIVQLRFTRLVFGLRPSPAILTSTIRHHRDAHVSEEFKPDFIELLKNSLYVDDLVTATSESRLCSKVDST